MGTACCITLYAGGGVYDFQSGDMSDATPVYIDYLKVMVKELATGGDTRPPGVADFTYRELCFAYDCTFGKALSSPIGAELRESCFDEVLRNHSAASAKTAEWLQSDVTSEYLAGLRALSALLYDGGHTIPLYSWDILSAACPERAAEVEALLSTVELPPTLDRPAIRKAIAAARTEAWGSATYFEEGDTAVFSFDTFDLDKDAWDAYYKGGAEIPGDTYGAFYRALEQASQNPGIKKFVLDLTTNRGGNSGPAMGLMALMCGGIQYMNLTDVGTGMFTQFGLMIDTDLDRAFDDSDLEKRYAFDFAILTTNASFSSGNLFPVLSQQQGVMIIGDRTGGGSHAVQYGGTADGFVMKYSSPTVIST